MLRLVLDGEGMMMIMLMTDLTDDDDGEGERRWLAMMIYFVFYLVFPQKISRNCLLLAVFDFVIFCGNAKFCGQVIHI